MSTHSQDRATLSPLTLERAAQGELTADAFEALGPEAAEQVARLAADSERLLQQYPPEREVPQILQKVTAAQRRQQQSRRRLVWAAAPAFAVALVLWMPLPDPDRSESGVRTKGPAILQVYRQTSGGEERLREDAPAAPGDVLQLRYDARGLAYGAIVSVDGAGVITPHLPERAQGPAARLERALVTLNVAYELDDAPNFERFFFVTSAHPFDMAVVQDALHDLEDDPDRIADAPLELGPGIEQVSLRIMKAGP